MPRSRWTKYLLIAFSVMLAILLTRPAATIVTERYITPISPPDKTSPRVTLSEFRSNMDLTYRLIMSAYESGQKDLGLRYSPAQQQKAYQAEEALERAIKTLDLSDIPPAQLEDVGVESALLLKEILDRILLPPEDQIPDIVAV
jgi:MscS family membrane protein